MRTDRSFPARALALLLTVVLVAPLFAQAASPAPATSGEPLFRVDNALNYSMIGLALVQVIFILSLAGIIRTMGGPAVWAKSFTQGKSRAAVLLPLLFALSHAANAQAYTGNEPGMSNYDLFWVLFVANVFLFGILAAQIVMLRSMIKAVVGAVSEPAGSVISTGPTWVDRLLKRLTRQVEIEKEQDVLMHHEYDGIRELDNVLPPWWVWLFYGSIAWSVVYLVNVHVIKIWPDQKTEYVNEMAQAEADVTAYKATLTNTVDENTVTASTEPDVLAAGKATFTQFCTACHGPHGAGSETSVGPNLTDPYWIHGGGIKNVFHTITYGVTEKGMISWKAQLQPAEIRAVASYILSLKGTGPADQKPPQGDLWTEPADSTGTAPDSTAAPADSARLVTN
ncbi:MAG: cbb3-type cytochrome c oxidase N-terminal domain-containing protein [Flavobacteriales bacterium]